MSLLRAEKAAAFPEIPADQIPECFTVRQGKSMLVMGVILIGAFGGAVAWNVVQNGVAQSLDLLAVGVICVLAGAVVLVKYKNHQLEVCGSELRYTDLFGRTSVFQVSEIAAVRRDISENPKLMAQSGGVLARCERSMENFPLLIAYLKKHNISADMI